MFVPPMYILALVFFLLSAVLFLLWQFRGPLLARLLPVDDVEVGPQFNMPPEYYATSTVTTAAPSYVINSLPVFEFKQQQHSSKQRQQQQQQQQHEEGQHDLQARSEQHPAAGPYEQQQQQQQQQQLGNRIQPSVDGLCPHHRTDSNCSDANSSSGNSSSDSHIGRGDGSTNIVGRDGGSGNISSSSSSSSLENAGSNDSSLCNNGSISSSGRGTGSTAAGPAGHHVQLCQLHAGPADLQQQMAACGTREGSMPGSPPCDSAGSPRRFESIKPVVGLQGREGMQAQLGLSVISPGAAANSSSSRSSYAASSSSSSPAGSSCGSVVQDGALSCVICFGDYACGELIKRLPCQHCYHAACIDIWLKRCATCPLCKQAVWPQGGPALTHC